MVIQPIKQNNFIWLTISLIAMLVAGALTAEFPDIFALHLIEYANIAFLLVALLSLRKNPSWLKGLLTLITIMLLLVIARYVTGLQSLDTIYLLLTLLFYISAMRLVAREVLLTGSVDFNKMVGSIALYLMLGLFFSVLFTILLQFSPDALNGLEAGQAEENLARSNYFSFVTLTTLGYGDISPATPMARVLVIIEAVTGMFYLAVIVASLVGSMKSSH